MPARLLPVLLLCAACSEPAWPGPELARLLTVLDAPEHTAEDRIGQRGAAAELFRRRVAEGGRALATEAARRAVSDDPRERRHAQLVLAVSGHAPDVDDPIYRALRDRDAGDPGRLRRPDLIRPAAEGADPLAAALPAILRHLLPERDPAPPAVKEEYARDWRTSLKPQLLALDRRVAARDRWMVDLDGDGKDECFVAVRDPLETHWIHDFRCVAVLRRSGAGWSLAGLRRFRENELIRRVIVGDFDADGRAEAAVWSTLLGGYSYGHLTMVCGSAPDGVRLELAAYRPGTDIPVISGRGGPPLFAVFNQHLPVDGPKVVEAHGVIATRCDLCAWDAGRFVRRGDSWLPLRS